MPRPKESQNTSWVLTGAVVIAVLVAIAFIAWPWLPGVDQSSPTATTGARSHQNAGESQAGKSSPPPPSAAPHSTAPSTVGRSEDITASAKNSVDLDPAQRKTVEDFYAKHAQDRIDHVDFTISVGAAVPGKVQLRDVPISLADALSAYSGDQYFMVPNQFVIVGKQTRRIVAIIPI